VDTNIFFRVVKAGFSQRRKTLLNALHGGLQLDKERITALLTQAGIDPGMRAQNLSMDQWHAIYTIYRSIQTSVQ
jgi:16S rRNA (adenine1518-N6/adenine1519-N6)-dimethyltransferase